VTIRVTQAQASAGLGWLMDRTTQDRQVVLIQRPGQEDVAMIAARELSGLLETIYLLRSPRNAQRLISALDNSLGYESTPKALDELRCDMELLWDDDASPGSAGYCCA